jgi:selenocysteine-specific elongation factor
LRQLILGTAGHIDHGKTSLIKAITGTDTDRLKEEKERGITIELGFAAIDLPSGQHLGIVDVPGHEKFIKNMVAGATGIDMVIMVIAADEGVMPQTVEHLEICSLLGIPYGLVALTKTDMVDEEWLELVIDDIRSFTQGTFLEDQPIQPVSSATREGLDDLLQALDQLAAKIPERPPTSIFRLPVDRVFTMKGFGTVITGTLVSGQVNVGDNIMIYPSGIASKVRGIQVHNESVTQAIAGQRTAINFQGLDKATVNRGDVLSMPKTLKPSYMVDVALNFLGSNQKPIKTRTRVRFHTGTNEILGNLVLLDREELKPGDATLAQLRLDRPVAIIKDDRFVIRSYSPVRTIGGGQVLNPIPPKHKRYREDILNALTQLTSGDTPDIVSLHLQQAGYQGLTVSDLAIMTNVSNKQLDTTLQSMMSQRDAIIVDKDIRRFIHPENFAKLQTESTAVLKQYHQSFPLKAGMPKEELKTKFARRVDNKLFTLMMNQMVKDNRLVQEGDLVHLAEHKVSLQVDQAEIRHNVLAIYKQSGLQPPFFREIIKKLDIDANQAKDVLGLLVDEGSIIKTKDDLYFYKDAIDQLHQRMVEFMTSQGEMTTPQFKEMTGASRKFVIPLLEYFDAQNVTIRIGDSRRLRKPS